MSARILDGKAFAAHLAGKVAAEAARLKSEHGITPGIAVVLVGDDPASAVYVAAKSRAVHEAGLSAFDHRYPASLSESGLIAQIESLNADSSVHGILVQMPLPAGIDANRVINAIEPLKDVELFKSFKLDDEFDTIVWATGADLAPEFLYERAVP